MGMNEYKSSWIWIRDEEQIKQEEPCIVYFRKCFSNSDKIRISANCRYKLYINGKFVQEGPQKGTVEMAFADEAEIGEYLCDGVNVAAAEVLYYPENSRRRNDSLYYSPFPCLYVEDLSEDTQLDGKNGWKYYAAGHIQVTGEPFIPAPIHGSEIACGCAEVNGWKEAGFDDAGWQDAVPYSLFDSMKPVAPFNLKPRTIPPMAHEQKSFREVVCVRESAAQTHESLKEQWEKLLNGTGTIEIPANTTQIVELSAGEEMCGYPSISMAGGGGAEIVFLYSEAYGIPQGEMDTPAGKRLLPPVKGDRTDFRNGCLQGEEDRYTPSGFGRKDAPEVYIPFLFRTFRYIQVRVTTKDQGMSILKYDYLSTGYPLEVKTRLTTSDETMNRIWDISLRTLKRCMHETYVDCPFYEQLQYTMDSRAEMLFTYALSTDDRLARQCMDAFRRTQRSDGILQACAPSVSVNVIPGFSIFYIRMIHDHMMYFGDRELVRQHFGCVDGILEFFRNHLTEKGLVGSVGGVLFQHRYWSFIDWCEEWNESIGVPTAALAGDGSLTMESLYYLDGLHAAEELARYIERLDMAQDYHQRAEELKQSILIHCSGKDGLIQDGPGQDLYSTHCQVWSLLTDVVGTEQGRRNIEKTWGVKGVPQCSVSMSFYLLEALKKAGMMKEADRLWNPWRIMLDNKMTTCVENFTDQRSDCHAWGSIILYALPAVYLGIRPTSPGFEAYEKNTDLGHLEWIRGDVITPKGVITVGDQYPAEAEQHKSPIDETGI